MNGKHHLRTAFIITAMALAPSARAQPAPTPKLASFKVALLIVDPPSNWVSLETTAKSGGSAQGVDPTSAPWIRFSQAMALAQQLKSEGADVKMLFLGPAVVWLAMDDIPQGQRGAKPAKSKGSVSGPHDAISRMRNGGIAISADDAAARVHGLHSAISGRGVKFHGVKDGEPGLIKLVSEGYEIVAF